MATVLPLKFGGAANAAVVDRGTGGTPLSEARPAPDSIKPDLSIVAAQPSPSEVNPAYLGPVLLMKQAQVDLVKGTARLPLRKGRLKSGELVWFVLTDTTDENLANLHGLDYSPKLAYALTGHAAREATIDPDGTFVFDSGKVDFSLDRAVMPGAAPNFFPPKSAQPGSVGDADYTPLVHIKNAAKDVLFNAPMLAFNVDETKLNTMCDGNADHKVVEDKIVSICPRDGWVTLQLTLGFTFSKPIFYLSTEANDPLVATLEGATYAPALKDLPFALEDASPGESAERLYTFANGPTGLENPQRQGLDSALSDGRGPLNILGGIPTINLDYSPMWRLFPAKWTDAAIQRGYRSRLTDAFAIEDMAKRGFLTGLDGGELKPVGFVVNCPVATALTDDLIASAVRDDGPPTVTQTFSGQAMRISSHRVVGLAVIATLGLLPTPGEASARVVSDAKRMTIGDPNAGHIDIVVKRTRGQAQSIAIRLHRVGAPGSRFTLSIGSRPVVAPFILNATQCRFDALGSLFCDLAIGPRDRGYRPLLAALQSGRRARVTVENAGNMAMSTEVSLRPLAGDGRHT